MDDKPEYQEEVERLLNSDPVRAEDSFFGSLLLRILNNIKAAWQKAVAAKETADKAIPASEKGAPGGVAALSPDGKLDVTVTAGEVGAMPADTPIVPPTRKVAGKPLTADIILGPGMLALPQLSTPIHQQRQGLQRRTTPIRRPRWARLLLPIPTPRPKRGLPPPAIAIPPAK